MSVAQDIRGLKRICMSCGTRFYDMNKRPIACPSCATEFTGEIKVKTRRSRVVAANDPIVEELEVKKSKIADEDDFLESEDIVSLDDVAAGDDGDDVEEEAIDPDLDPDLEDIDAIDADIDDGLGAEDEDLEIDADLDDER